MDYSYWNVQCLDRTDGTRWTIQFYTQTEDEARTLALAKIAPHVTIERIVPKAKQGLEDHAYEASVSPGICRVCGRSIHVHKAKGR